MKKLVILDLDNTLYDEREYFFGVFDCYESLTGLNRGELSKAFNSVDRISSKDILKDILYAADIYCKNNHDILFSCYKSARFDLEIPRFSREFLFYLSMLGCYVAVLTNGVIDVQKNKVKNLGVDELCDKIFYARDNGNNYEKPDRRSFETVLDFFNCNANEAIMIGDSFKNDYCGAKHAGIDALWLGGNNADSISTLEEAIPYIMETPDEKD